MKKSLLQPSVSINASYPGKRGFARSERSLVGHAPTIAITPVADGRTGAGKARNAPATRLLDC